MSFKIVLILTSLLTSILSFGQEVFKIEGTIKSEGQPLPDAIIEIENQSYYAIADSLGHFTIDNIKESKVNVIAHFSGKLSSKKSLELKANSGNSINFDLKNDEQSLEEVVISGTMKAISRIESPVPVEVYRPSFFKKNPTANIFEALQNVNGVRPQINCNVCNTGDIHINGLEGPYTMVLIDGMPIVSGLSTVYGLSGIPNSLIERVEIVKGPASSLYGSEAVGGLINIITKNPFKAPKFTLDLTSNLWGEINTDIGFKFNLTDKTSVLLGVNYFNYSNPIDNNNDNFTDLTLQDRISVFQKWQFERKENRIFSLAARYFYEDRWGGEMQWDKSHRGGDEVYGESIYTRRMELLGNYQLPFKEKMFLTFSFTDHDQNSVYGQTRFLARQKIGFLQANWNKTIGNHDLLLGSSLRYNDYNDNTPATITNDEKVIPSIFLQNEIKLHPNHQLLLGARLDNHENHGNIFTPRFAYKWKISDFDILRLNSGTGFRVVNLFTEDHAALTGSRDVIILEDLQPEKSVNVNLNYLKKMVFDNGNQFTIESTAWYTYFKNSIIPDYETNPLQIIYKNLDGHAVTKGFSINADMNFMNGIKATLGGTLMDVSKTENNIKSRPMLTEKYSATWSISYKLEKYHLNIDYTGNLYGPMKLPLLGENDPRSPESPIWSIQNIQFTYDKFSGIEIFGGVKNLLNWTPNKGNPFLIARANDPFDKDVQFDSNGNPQVSPNNPYGLTFDPSYVYGPNQGIRVFVGMRYHLF